MKKITKKLEDKVLLFGFDQKNACVYSDFLSTSDYYEELHVWDSGKKIKVLKLAMIRGYIFGTDGVLEQQFETVFNPSTGQYVSSWMRDENGKLNDIE